MKPPPTKEKKEGAIAASGYPVKARPPTEEKKKTLMPPPPMPKKLDKEPRWERSYESGAAEASASATAASHFCDGARGRASLRIERSTGQSFHPGDLHWMQGHRSCVA